MTRANGERAFPADDHFTLYPIFAFHSLDLLGWELAPVVLRQVVRYLATVPPVARDLVDKEGFSLIAKQVRTPTSTTMATRPQTQSQRGH
eukprot:COSAG04_NODE_3544_length_2721_cov_2.400076_2_plen_90_part_00